MVKITLNRIRIFLETQGKTILDCLEPEEIIVEPGDPVITKEGRIYEIDEVLKNKVIVKDSQGKRLNLNYRNIAVLKNEPDIGPDILIGRKLKNHMGLKKRYEHRELLRRFYNPN